METRFELPKEFHFRFQVQDQVGAMNAGEQKLGQLEAKFYLHEHSTNKAKRKRGSQMHFPNEVDLLKTEAAPQKKRGIQIFRQQGANTKLSFPLLKKVDTFPFPRKHVAGEYICLSGFEERINLNVQAAQSSESSVGSCSGFLSNSKLHCENKPLNRPPVSSPLADAQSSWESSTWRKTEPLTRKDLAGKVHKLELCAYRETIRAFFASGCLTWEQESLLTDLRFSLNICHEEHLSELACLRQPIGSSPLDDAEAFLESSDRRTTEPLTEKDIAAKVHKLKLFAYRKTIRAFFALGCLAWENEALLTDLRLSLNISHDEHLSELACLHPAQAV